MTDVGITLILNPFEIVLARIGLNICPTDSQQGTQQATAMLAHRSDTRQTRAAQQIEDYGFRLVVAMVCKHQPVGIGLGKCRVTHPSGGSFQTIFRFSFNRHAHTGKRDSKPVTTGPAEVLPLIGIRADVVMYMKGREPERCVIFVPA